jgi:hypothetical protein
MKKLTTLLFIFTLPFLSLNTFSQAKAKTEAAAEKAAARAKEKADKKAAQEKEKADKAAQAKAKAVTTNPTTPVRPVANPTTNVTPSKPVAPTVTHAPTPANPNAADKVIGTDDKGRTIYEGKRGGHYYINKNGNKEYIKKNGK